MHSRLKLEEKKKKEKKRKENWFYNKSRIDRSSSPYDCAKHDNNYQQSLPMMTMIII